MTIGEQVRLARARKGLTQRALADQAGVDRKTIVAIELGQVERPQPVTLAALADTLDLDLTDLLSRKGE